MANRFTDTYSDSTSDAEPFSVGSSLNGWISDAYTDDDIFGPIDVVKDQTYRIVLNNRGTPGDFDTGSPLELRIVDGFHGYASRVADAGERTVFFWEAPATFEVYLWVDARNSFFSGEIPYTVAINAPGDGGPSGDPDALPPLDPPDPGTPEASIYTGDRVLPRAGEPDDDPHVIKYYLAPAAENAGGRVAEGWNSYEETQARAAFDAYERVGNLRFEQTGIKAEANFILATVAALPDGNDGLAEFPDGDPGEPQHLWFRRDGFGWHEDGGNGLKPGGRGFSTLIHEIGHALGFDHLHDDRAGSDIWADVSDLAAGRYSTGKAGLNQDVFSVMSYNEGWSGGPDARGGYGHSKGPMALDIAVMARLYGEKAAGNRGDTVYTLPDANAPGTGYETIFDTGGDDLIRAMTSKDARIDLNDATLAGKPGGGGFVSHVKGVAGGLTIANGGAIERANGSAGNDTLIGNERANRLQGGGGNDEVFGRGANDTLLGMNGKDTLEGNGGADLIRGGANRDVLKGGNRNDTLHGENGRDTLEGGGGKDKLHGGALRDLLDGGGRDDSLYGEGGNDILGGRRGADLIDGGPGIDTVSFKTSKRGVNVDLESGTASGDGGDTIRNVEYVRGSEHNDVIAGDGGRNHLVGFDGVDKLEGRGGRDKLEGGVGNDILIGGPGNDILIGGPGGDIYRFLSSRDLGNSAATRDEIYGFNPAVDVIDLARLDAKAGVSGNQAFDFIGRQRFSGEKGELRYATNDTITVVRGDQDGDGRSDFEIALETPLNLQSDDFIL
ncbi:MAG: M10 family metallopeptidase [Acuticoccus sp.]